VPRFDLVADNLLELCDVPVDLVFPFIEDLLPMLAVGGEEGPEEPVDIIFAPKRGYGRSVKPARDNAHVTHALEAVCADGWSVGSTAWTREDGLTLEELFALLAGNERRMHGRLQVM
jgi:hypothetical protein